MTNHYTVEVSGRVEYVTADSEEELAYILEGVSYSLLEHNSYPDFERFVLAWEPDGAPGSLDPMDYIQEEKPEVNFAHCWTLQAKDGALFVIPGLHKGLAYLTTRHPWNEYTPQYMI